MLKVNEKLKVKIIGLDYKGDGIAKIDNTFLFIPGVLEDEEVLVEIVSLKKNYGTAKLLEVIVSSTDRVKPTSQLGSLSLEHLSFEKQLLWQEKITKQTLEKVLNTNLNVLETITDGIETNYRNKVVFHVIKGNLLKLGLFSSNNQDLVVVNNFVLANKQVNELVKLINDSKIIIAENTLENIVFKNNSQDEILVTLVSKKSKFKGLNEIVKLLNKDNNVKGITINLKKQNNKIISNESILLYGNNLLKEGILLLNDQSFMQVNYGVANLVYQLIKENIYGIKIVDAYSGIGSIGFSIYDNNYQITMIENNDANINLAKVIKHNNNYHNVTIIKANAENVIKEHNPMTIIVDPPRKGLDKTLINALITNEIPKVIYLSCDLQTLVRDLKLFSHLYNFEKVYPIKMFPQTNSFETLVVLKRKKE